MYCGKIVRLTEELSKEANRK